VSHPSLNKPLDETSFVDVGKTTLAGTRIIKQLRSVTFWMLTGHNWTYFLVTDATLVHTFLA